MGNGAGSSTPVVFVAGFVMQGVNQFQWLGIIHVTCVFVNRNTICRGRPEICATEKTVATRERFA